MIDAGFAADSEPSGAIELVYGGVPPIRPPPPERCLGARRDTAELVPQASGAERGPRCPPPIPERSLGARPAQELPQWAPSDGSFCCCSTCGSEAQALLKAELVAWVRNALPPAVV